MYYIVENEAKNTNLIFFWGGDVFTGSTIDVNKLKVTDHDYS